ncbi:uncharacterized protein LOC129905752 [Episyrphus balteatus]|uniref:uncharacterized protein LOC129905752 n=1 Tax=Episyrphus balteatus TaxID=286459 RepID=UPI0024868194|nr:uncharacterized protein LOC129905752 [Episyrphus balteatus]
MNIKYQLIAIIAILSHFCKASKFNINLSDLETCQEYYLQDKEYGYKDFFEVNSMKQNLTKDNELLHLKFYVTTSKDAHILLSEDYNPKWETESSARGYEIVLGGVRNSISWISVGGNAKVRVPIRVNSPNMISILDPMPVEIIQTIDGQLFVNIPGFSEPLLKYSDTPPVNIQFFSFGTYGNTSAKWYYNCQFDGYSHVESQKMSESGVQTVETYVKERQFSAQPKSTGTTEDRNQKVCSDKQASYSGTDPNNRLVSFFLGLVPVMVNFKDDQVLDFQVAVIEVLKKIKNRPTTTEEPIAMVTIR